MKNTNKCPKCGSSDIIKIPGYAGAYGTGNNIMVGISIKSAVPVDRYLCGDCGYSEEWIDTEYIEKIKKKFDN
uniref:hypothetical protein n=1 Tax=Anaerococcus mediterraneensis TaxID=1870984 RepID=UPI000931F907|nr:hypothetical protein [Anaerococcus mediterraneensis]